VYESVRSGRPPDLQELPFPQAPRSVHLPGLFIFTNMPVHRSIPRPLIGFYKVDDLSIDEIGFLAKLQTISCKTDPTSMDTELFLVPLTVEQIAEHVGLHENTVKKLRKSLVQKEVLIIQPATHPNGARSGNYYQSPITFTF